MGSIVALSAACSSCSQTLNMFEDVCWPTWADATHACSKTLEQFACTAKKDGRQQFITSAPS